MGAVVSRAAEGFLVSLEGPDGVGKSTQAQRLARALRRRHHRVLAVRDPGTTALGEAVRSLLLDPAVQPPPVPWAEVALFLAARVQLLAEVIEPALADGQIVVTDRFVDSTLVYQGAGRDLDPERLLALHELVGASRRPDLTVLLDLPAERARDRMGRELPLDRLETEPPAYHARVREGFRRLAVRYPERVVVVDADRPPGEVAQTCLQLVTERLGLAMTDAGRPL